MIKMAIVLTLICASITAFGQQGRTVSPLKKEKTNARSGVYVGADYTNLTDMHVDLHVFSNDGTFDENYSDSYTGHLGIAGLRAGYSYLPPRGIGFNAGLRFLQTINKSEYGESKRDLLIPEANLQVSLNRYFVPYIGLNISKWSSSNSSNEFSPGLGGQVGLAFRPNRDLEINAGYTLLTQTMKLTENNFNSKGTLLAGGFSTNINFLF